MRTPSPARCIFSWLAAGILLSAVSGCADSPGDGEARDDAGVDVTADERVSPDIAATPDTALRDHSADGPLQDGWSLADRSAADGDVTSFDGGNTGVEGSPADADASSCTIGPIWNASTATFTLSSTSSFPTKPPPGKPTECAPLHLSYEFDLAKRTLTKGGCLSFRRVLRVAPLGDAEIKVIVSALQAVQSACAPVCRNTGWLERLAVRDTAGCAQGSWDNDPCAFGALPPFVAAADVDKLIDLFDAIILATCDADGAPTDSGVCDPARDGGTSVCMGAPGDAGADPHDGALDAPPTDAEGDGDGALCVSRPLPRDFTSFNFSVRAASDRGCAGANVSYNLSLQSKTLWHYDCVNGQSITRRVDLIDAQIDTIFARMETLHSVCGSRCGAGGIAGGLSLGDCDRSLGNFSSDFYVDCDQPLAPPFIESTAIVALDQLLRSIISDSCAPTGDAESPGVCAPRCRQIAH